MYKLRHFALFLFQSMNLQAATDHSTTTRSNVFPRDLNLIKHAEGVKLILQAADCNYYLNKLNFSKGMYQD